MEVPRFCNFEQGADGLWRCTNPGCRGQARSRLASRNCHADPAAKPAENVQPTPRPRSCDCCYREAYRAWEAAGKPERSQTEVDRLLAICRRCDQWGRGRVAYVLTMGTFQCPSDRWSPDGPIVAIVTRILGARSGGMRSLLALAETLLDRGFRVWGVTTDRIHDGPAGMKTLRLSWARMGELVDRLPGKPAAIICNPSDVPVVQPAATKHGVPFVVYVQFWRGLIRPIESDVLRQLDSDSIPAEAFDRENILRIGDAGAIVANSEYTARQVERITGRQCSAVAQPFLGDVRCNGMARNPRFVIMPSAQWGKGAHRFFILALSNPDVQFLLLAGDAMCHESVVRAAEKIANVTVEQRWVDDMRPVYAEARALFVGTETCETFCRAAAEARVNGVPILALAAGNLPNIVRDDGGICVDRDASHADWQTAFRKVLAMTPDPTDEFAQDHRFRMIDVIDDVRRLSEIYMPLPTAPGIKAVVEHAQRVLGVTVVPWGGPVDQYADAKLIVCPWQVPSPVLKLGKPTLLWWHSHCAQMDTSRRELTAMADAWDHVAANPHLSLAFGHRSEADLWTEIHPGRSVYLPAVLDCSEISVPKTGGGVFIAGPYGPRKNVATALAACRLADQVAHVTGAIRSHPELLRFAVALGCRLKIHECPTVADVQAVAGACDVALMLSTAETFCYAAAECVLAGTPVIAWRGLPVLATLDNRAWHVADPTDVRHVTSAILSVHPTWLPGQLCEVRAVADRRKIAARLTLLERLHAQPDRQCVR